jgi:putative endonuclease
MVSQRSIGRGRIVLAGRCAYIAVYILSDGVRGTLYVGVTSDLFRRMYEHREGVFDGYTKKYGISRLVWYEPHEAMSTALQREKSLKRYLRDWKISLVERQNPHWADLYDTLNS